MSFPNYLPLQTYSQSNMFGEECWAGQRREKSRRHLHASLLANSPRHDRHHCEVNTRPRRLHSPISISFKLFSVGWGLGEEGSCLWAVHGHDPW